MFCLRWKEAHGSFHSSFCFGWRRSGWCTPLKLPWQLMDVLSCCMFNGLRAFWVTRFFLIPVLTHVLAAIGDQSLAEFVLFNKLETLAFLSVVSVFLNFSIAPYQLTLRDQTTFKNSLSPLLLESVLSALVFPVRLIWAPLLQRSPRVGPLQCYYYAGGCASFANELCALCFHFGLGYMIIRLAWGALRSSILPKTQTEIGTRNAITSVVVYVAIFWLQWPWLVAPD